MKKTLLGLAIAALIGGTFAAPVFAKDDNDRDDRGRGHDKGWHKGQQRGERGYDREYDRDYYRNRRDPYYYYAPVYVPPPVYYPPPQAPGINLFLPLDLRR